MKGTAQVISPGRYVFANAAQEFLVACSVSVGHYQQAVVNEFDVQRISEK
jgi:hypothetical protein